MRNENDLKEYLGDLKEIAAIYGVRVSNKGEKIYISVVTLHPSQQFFSHVGMGFPGFNQY